jgi:hypothetical protein
MTKNEQAHHVFSEALSKCDTMAFLDEVSYRKRVLICVSTCKPLVCHIKERIMLLLLDNVADLLPLLLGRVNPGRIMSAGVQQYDRLLGSGFEISDHAIEVQPNCVLVVVPVLLHRQARVPEDSIVVRPTRGWDVDSLSMWVETLEEGTTYSESTCTGDRLSDSYAVFPERQRLRPVGEAGSGFCEGRDAGDSSVFFVEL